MKKTALIAVAGVFSCVAQNASAIAINDDFQVITTVGAFSEYSMRGISFSQRKPVIQGSAILAHSSGLYAGVWGSNVDLVGVDSSYEADYIIGYQHFFNEDVNLDVGYIKYTYPKGTILNAGETYGVLTAYGFKVGTYYSNDYYGGQAFTYNYIGYGTKALPYDVGLDLRFGVSDFKDPAFFSSDGRSTDNYHEWEVKFSKNWVGVDWTASYVDTDLSETECLSFSGDKESCQSRFVIGVSKTF